MNEEVMNSIGELNEQSSELEQRLRTASDSLRLCIGIATRGRPAILCSTLEDLFRQTRQPDEVIVCVNNQNDLGDAPVRFPNVTYIDSAAGLTKQRNAIVEKALGHDVLVFLDDDFYLQADYLAAIENVFRSQPEVVVATGRVLADGINGPGLTVDEAKQITSNCDPRAGGDRLSPVFNAYGCNMCIRLAPVRKHKVRFDETLPLYGWYEDVDFSRRLALYGNVVNVSKACGVHLGAKVGRVPGVRLGYSQVANPVYLARKGSVSWAFAIASATSRFSKNVYKSLAPESYVDRRGRLKGNLLGFLDLLKGRLCPLRAAEL